jgi:predicted phosphoadenosine phosphosulfate sulfurtransferase
MGLSHDRIEYNTNVLEEASKRIKSCFQRFDKVVVSFSGGKDSTVVLNLAYETAKKLNKLPLEVIYIDEEALTFQTIEYVNRVSDRTDLNFYWYCLPIKHRNACSNNEPWWYPWEPSKKNIWCRELPDKAILTHPRFKPGQTMPEFCDGMYQEFNSNVCFLTGIRAQESLRRRGAVLRKRADNYIAHKYGNTHIAHPIYDWSSEDVWHSIHKFNWDYNKYYDALDKLPGYHNRFLKQRVSNAFGEEPLRGIGEYQLTDPELWEKMQDRVRGARTALRYANAGLYTGKILPPSYSTWKEYYYIILSSYDEPYKSLVKKGINSSIKIHYRGTNDSIPDDRPHYITGCSWKFLCDCALRGDLKGRKKESMKTKASGVKP